MTACDVRDHCGLALAKTKKVGKRNFSYYRIEMILLKEPNSNTRTSQKRGGLRRRFQRVLVVGKCVGRQSHHYCHHELGQHHHHHHNCPTVAIKTYQQCEKRVDLRSFQEGGRWKSAHVDSCWFPARPAASPGRSDDLQFCQKLWSFW